MQLISSTRFKKFPYCVTGAQLQRGCACRVGAISGADVCRSEWAAAWCPAPGTGVCEWGLRSDKAQTLIYLCWACHSKSGDTEKVSYHGYKNCPHHFLSEALYNPFPFPVIYFIWVIFIIFFNVFICLFVCPRAGFLAGAALIGLLFPFPLIHSRNIRVRGFDY